MQIAIFTLIPLFIAIAMSAYIDARHRRIPNWLTASILIAGIVTAGIRPDFNMSQAIGGAAIGLVGPFLLFALGMLGAGDAKLLAAIGAWTGPVGIIWVILFTGVAGGVMALATSAYTGQLKTVLRNTYLIGMNLLMTRRTHWISATDQARAEAAQKKVTLPYAVAIFVGLVTAQILMATGTIG